MAASAPKIIEASNATEKVAFPSSYYSFRSMSDLICIMVEMLNYVDRS